MLIVYFPVREGMPFHEYIWRRSKTDHVVQVRGKSDVRCFFAKKQISHYSDAFTVVNFKYNHLLWVQYVCHSQYPYYACFKKNSSHELNITLQTAKTYTVRHCSREVYACTCTSMISHPLMIFSVFFKLTTCIDIYHVMNITLIET